MDSLNNYTPANGNTFPVHAFPEAIQEIIHNLRSALQFPPDFTGASILYAASLAIGNTHKIRIKNGWYDSAVLYTALVGRPGAAKTPPIKFILKPLQQCDSQSYKVYKERLSEYTRISGLSKKERKEEGIHEDPVKPILFKYIIQDFTPEALIQVHANNLRGLGVYADELASWYKNFERYNKGSEEQFWLSVFNNTVVGYDRKSSDSIRIDSPFISVIGGIQPAVLNELASNNRSGNGFLDRLLFAMPEDVVKNRFSETELHPIYSDNWHAIINRLLEIEAVYDDEGNITPYVLDFTPEAKQVYVKWFNHNADLCNNADSDSLKSLYSKFDYFIARISLILQMLQYATGESTRVHIEADTIERAILLVEYFRLTGLRVHGILNSTPYDRLSTIQRRVYDLLPNTFNTKDGVSIATSADMSDITFKRFLHRTDLFAKEKHGQYSKKF